jgi:excinuclease ABC subunit A
MAKSKETAADVIEQNGQEYIEVYGAREHNLKNIDLRIPRTN